VDALRRENQQLRSQAVQSLAIARENDQFRNLLGWQRQSPWRLKLANVVMRDPANWWRTVQIDLGSRDGLRENLPVITSAGLVGRVSSVSLTRAQIVLIGDPNCRVSATVENPARDIGVIVASGPVDTSLVDLTYLASSANLKPGQSVVTSGLGGVFPKGIPIGQVVDSRSVEFGLYTDARVKLNANLGSLEQVWVLFP
jgi:rod shape-determining protein MreC